MKSFAIVFATAFLLTASSASNCFAQVERPTIVNSEIDRTLVDDVDPKKPLYEKFERLLTGAKLNGMFTIDGRSMDDLKPESYEIEKVQKGDEGDLWLITARIRYGKHDVSFPVPVNVKWADETPVLTLDDVTIPGLGTFGARVVFHKDKYAGTWQHDDVGGHLFGKIELASSSTEAPASDAK